jgi:3-oxoacyl-[acyl-carrier protein] reductase
MAFSQALAQHLTPKVRVNCVAPGWIRTKWGEGTSDYWDERARTESLSHRWGDAQDIAAAIGFLASPTSDFINATILPVNGGQRCYAASKPYSGSSPFNAVDGQ